MTPKVGIGVGAKSIGELANDRRLHVSTPRIREESLKDY